jgi:hypothetical protein
MTFLYKAIDNTDREVKPGFANLFIMMPVMGYLAAH